MKKLSFFFGLSLLLLAAGENYGQTYYPLVTAGKSYSLSYFYASPPAQVRYEKLGSDTVINSITYTKVLRTPDSTSSPWSVAGFIRETSDHKVYYSTYPSAIEYLCYDFNLHVGDTVTLKVLPSPHTVISVDSVQINNGQFRQRIVLSNPLCPDPDTWIVGIGSLYGLIYSAGNCFIGETTRLICMNEDNELIYHNPDFATCDFPMGTPAMEDQEMIRLEYVSDRMITLDSKMEGTASFYDLVGHLTFQCPVRVGQNSLSHQFQRNTMYIISVRADKQVYTKKIIF